MEETVVVRRGRAKPIWFGHPWVYSEAIARSPTAPVSDEVRVVDEEDRFIGRGFFSPRSQIRVRIASRRDEPLDAAWLTSRLAAARDLRARLGLPGPDTDAYRLINSEGDF